MKYLPVPPKNLLLINQPIRNRPNEGMRDTTALAPSEVTNPCTIVNPYPIMNPTYASEPITKITKNFVEKYDTIDSELI